MHGLYYNYTLKKINEMPLYDAVKQVEFYWNKGQHGSICRFVKNHIYSN